MQGHLPKRQYRRKAKVGKKGSDQAGKKGSAKAGKNGSAKAGKKGSAKAGKKGSAKAGKKGSARARQKSARNASAEDFENMLLGDGDTIPGLLEEDSSDDDFDALGMGLVSSDDENETAPDDVDVCFEDVEDTTPENDIPSEEPPLLVALRKMLLSLDTSQLSNFLVTWAVLAELSKKHPLGSASGCTGSGMDWWMLQLLVEASPT